MHHRPQTLVFSALILVGTGLLFVVVPKGFIPSEDQGQIFGYTEAAQDVSFDAMVQYQRAVAGVVRANLGVDAVMSSVGVGGAATGTNSGIIFARLKPRSERAGVDEVIAELRGPVNAIPGVRVFLQNPPTIRVGGQLTKSLYQYTLQSNDLSTLYRWAPRREERVRRIPGWIVQGRFDVVTPMESAWKLKTAWPEARFEVVWDAGHASTEPGIVDALVRATDQALKL